MPPHIISKPWISRKNDKALKIMKKTQILLWKTIKGNTNRRLRIRVRVRFHFWNWNFWTLFGSEIEVGGGGDMVSLPPPSGYAPVYTLPSLRFLTLLPSFIRNALKLTRASEENLTGVHFNYFSCIIKEYCIHCFHHFRLIFLKRVSGMKMSWVKLLVTTWVSQPDYWGLESKL